MFFCCAQQQEEPKRSSFIMVDGDSQSAKEILEPQERRSFFSTVQVAMANSSDHDTETASEDDFSFIDDYSYEAETLPQIPRVIECPVVNEHWRIHAWRSTDALAFQFDCGGDQFSVLGHDVDSALDYILARGDVHFEMYSVQLKQSTFLNRSEVRPYLHNMLLQFYFPKAQAASDENCSAPSISPAHNCARQRAQTC